MLAIAGVQSFADLLRTAYPPSEGPVDTGSESCTMTWWEKNDVATHLNLPPT